MAENNVEHVIGKDLDPIEGVGIGEKKVGSIRVRPDDKIVESRVTDAARDDIHRLAPALELKRRDTPIHVAPDIE